MAQEHVFAATGLSAQVGAKDGYKGGLGQTRGGWV